MPRTDPRQSRSRVCAVALGLSLCAASLPAHATAPPTDGPTAGDLFRDGQSRADAADYAGAIKNFEEAFALLPDEEANEGTRNRLRVELVRAHRKTFEIDGDKTHLTKAKVLLGDYVASLDETQDENREWAEFELMEIEASLRDLEKAQAKAAPAPAESSPAESEEPQLEISQTTNPPPEPVDPRAGRGLFVAGGVLAGLGVGSAILMAAGLGKAGGAVDQFETEPENRESARSDNQLGNSMGIAGGVAAGVFLTAGAVLLVLGAKKKKGGSRTEVAPVFTGEQIGAVLRARF